MRGQDAFSRDFLVHESRLDETLRKLKRLSGLATKLGLPEYAIDITGEVTKPRPGTNLADVFKKLSFAGQHPTFSGWRFLAKLEHLEPGSNVIKSWSEGLDAKYQSCSPNCDHCNLNRLRNATFLVEKSGTGEVLQVGSTCVDDFIGGHADPNAMLALLNGLGEITWDEQEPFYDPEDALGGGSSTSYATTLRVIEIACAVIRKDGTYFSAQSPSPQGMTTKDEVAYHLFSKGSSLRVTGPDETEAQQILEWLKSDNGDTSNYRHNLRVLAHQDAIDVRKHLGLMVSAPTAYRRAMATEKKKATHANVHIGQAGEKWKGREVIFEGSPYFETQWGTSYNVLMRDKETGGTLKWTTSSPLPFLKGERYFINGTINGHDVWNDEKQTLLTRVTCPDLSAIVKLSNSLRHPENLDKNAKAILKSLVDPNVVNNRGETLLITANLYTYNDADRDSPVEKVVAALLEAGADPLQGKHYDTRMKHALDVAIVFGGGCPKLVDAYLAHLKGQGVDLATVSTLLSDSKDDKATWLHDIDTAPETVAVAERHGLPVHADTYASLKMPVPAAALTGSLHASPGGFDIPNPADEYEDELDDVLELNPASARPQWHEADVDLLNEEAHLPDVPTVIGAGAAPCADAHESDHALDDALLSDTGQLGFRFG